MKDPSQASAEIRWRRDELSEGTRGVLTSSASTERREPEGNGFLLPPFCVDSPSLGSGAGAVELHGFKEVQSALVGRRAAAPAMRFELTCHGEVTLGFATPESRGAKDVIGQVPLMSTSDYTLSTTPANVVQLREVSHVVQLLAGLTAGFAAIPASICGIGVAVSNPPPAGEPDVHDLAGQKAAFTTCALVSTPIALAGILVALIDPTIVTEYPLDGSTASAPREVEPEKRTKSRRRKGPWGKQ